MLKLVIALCLLSPLALCTTTLEEAVTKSHNELVGKGTWAGLFGSLPNLNKGSFCSGPGNAWPRPGVENESDLDRVLKRGYFVCGYNANFSTSTSDGVEMLNTYDPANVTGVLVNWWAQLIQRVGLEYGIVNLEVKWEVQSATSQGTLERVYDGTYDAACARWSLDAFWTNPNGNIVPRAKAFSPQHCVTYLESSSIWVKKPSDIVDFNGFIAALDQGQISKVCTPGSPGGGTTQSCSASISQYTFAPVICTGELAEAFPKLDSGDCDAVISGFPTSALDTYNQFDTIGIYAAGTLFRNKDLSETQDPDDVDSDESASSVIAVSFTALILSLNAMLF